MWAQPTEVCCKPTTDGTRGPYGDEYDHASSWMTESMHSSKKVLAKEGLKEKRLPHSHSSRAAVACAKSKTESACRPVSCVMKRDDRDAFPLPHSQGASLSQGAPTSQRGHQPAPSSSACFSEEVGMLG